MADEVRFSKGLSSSLPSDKVPGRILIETDTGRMHLDVDTDIRIDIGGSESTLPDTTLIVDLSSDTSDPFNGTNNVDLGVKNILPTAHGGLGNDKGYVQTGVSELLQSSDMHNTYEGSLNTVISGDNNLIDGEKNCICGNSNHVSGTMNVCGYLSQSLSLILRSSDKIVSGSSLTLDSCQIIAIPSQSLSSAILPNDLLYMSVTAVDSDLVSQGAAEICWQVTQVTDTTTTGGSIVGTIIFGDISQVPSGYTIMASLRALIRPSNIEANSQVTGTSLSGHFNVCNSNNCSIFGTFNKIDAASPNSLMNGQSNSCSNSDNSICTGTVNRCGSSNSAVFGSNNSTAVNSECVLVSGLYNGAGRSYQFISGRGSEVAAGPTSSQDQSGSLMVIGNGSVTYADTAIRKSSSNAFRVATSGAVYGSGEYNSSGADYAEMFEWEDGNPNSEDRRGRFVTPVGDKIRLASSDDAYILGVVSANPAILGDSYFGDNWHNKYLHDVFGQILTETEEVPESTDAHGKIIPAHTVTKYVLNPEYDPDQKYIPRSERSEWSAIGMLGKLVVVDDGTCSVDEYCKVSSSGIASASSTTDGYRVLRRIDETHIQIIFR